MDHRKVNDVIQKSYLQEMKEFLGYHCLWIPNPETLKEIDYI